MKRSSTPDIRRRFELLESRVVLDNHGLVINEFMASNKDTLLDQDSESSDWIEIHNSSDSAIDLAGWNFTDDASDPQQWKFPSQQIGAGEYLLVFASGKNRAQPNAELHTNFKLKADGEFLALSDPLGDVQFSYEPNFPSQSTDVSYGINAGGENRYFNQPTPGAENGEGIQIAANVVASHDSGFYEAAFQLELTTTETNSVVRYTTNGAMPTSTEGSEYDEPITISISTVIRAAVFRDGFEPSEVSTRTFLFIEDVLRQSNESITARGFPSTWGSEFRRADYEMDADVIGPNGTDLYDGVYAATIRDDLKSIASLSLVVDQEEFFGSEGIYSNPEGRGQEFEKAVTGEIIDPVSGMEVQFDAGIRLQGGISRTASNKNSLRLAFRSEYGDGTLSYPVFGEDAASEFNSITLRASSGEQFVNVHYIRDRFVRQSQLATEGAASNGRFLHLYINGLYWGVYEAVERPDAQFMANYYGGDKDNWDVLNAGDLGSEEDTAIDGNVEAWERLIELTKDIRRSSDVAEKEAIYQKLQGKNPDGTASPDFENLLDVDNYIDYLLTNWHAANSDWPHRNYYMGRDNGPDSTGFKFVVWDSEFTLGTERNVGNECVDERSFREERGPAALFQGLLETEGFRVRFADRIQKHFSPGGAFYVNDANPNYDPDRPEDNVPAARYQEIADSFVQPLVAESARWGDGIGTFGREQILRDETWLPRVEEHLEFMASRSPFLLSCFAASDMYRQAPTFSTTSTVYPTGGGSLSMETEQGDIYFTTDGTDPRNPDGSISQNATTYTDSIDITTTMQITTRSLDDDKWSAVQSHTYIINGQADASSLRFTEIHYHPVDPSDAERAAGFTDADEFEFIEFLNTSDETIDLTGAELLQKTTLNQESGVAFQFVTGTELGPGASLVVVENVQAFQARYGSEIPIAGEWQGKLDNGDETIRLALNGLTIHEVRYSDDWYPKTDGEGKSLQIRDAESFNLQQWNRAAGWSTSAAVGGTPGRQASALPGDVDFDGEVTASDIDALYAAIHSGSDESQFDLDLDGEVSSSDVDYLVTGPILGTIYGDSDLDGEVGFADFLLLSANFGKTGGWAAGDVDGDGEVGFADFLVLSREFGRTV